MRRPNWPLGSCEDVCDGLRMPLSAARRSNPTGIERLCNLPEGARARLLSLSDDRKHVSGIPICLGLYRPYGTPARLGEPGVAKGHAASLRSRKSLTGPRGDERALLLCQCGEQVEDK